MEKIDKTYNEILDILEDVIVNKAMFVFDSAGKKITKEQAKNLIVKVGAKLLKEQLTYEK